MSGSISQGVKGLRKQNPVSPAKITYEPVSTRRRSARASNSSTIKESRKSLDPVHEEEDTITVSNNDTTNDAIEVEEEVLADEEEVDNESDDYSEWDDEDVVSLDKDIIIDNLNAINVDVDDIFRLISSTSASEVFQGVQDPSSGIAKRFRHFSQRLINNLEPCGNEVLLQPSRLSRFVSSGEMIDNVEKLFIRANLALVIVKLLQARWDEQDETLDNLLSYLAEIKTFPTPFLQHDAPGRSKSAKFTRHFRSLTIEVGLSILTQWFLWNAEKKSNQDHVDPDALAIAVFFQEDHAHARDISLDSSTHRSSTVSKAIDARVGEIQRFYTLGERNSVRLDDLKEKFPVQKMVEDVIDWAIARKEQLDLSIEEQGGIERVRDRLWNKHITSTSEQPRQRRKKRKSRGQALAEGAAFLRNVDEYLDATAPETGEAGETPDQEAQTESPTVPRNLNEIEETPQPDEAAVQPSPAAETAQELAEAYNLDVMNDDTQSIPDAPPSAQPEPLRDITQDVIDGEDSIRAAANKENLPYQKPRLTDRQPNATRDNFDSPEPTPRNNGKRIQSPVESDDVFQMDPRPQKRVRTDKGKVSHPRPNVTAQSGMFFSDHEDIQSSPLPRRPIASPPHRARASSSQPVPVRSTSGTQSEDPAPSTFAGYQAARANVKPNLQMTTSILPPSTNPSTNLQAAYPSHQTLHNRVQVRRAWTPGEIERLLVLIKEHQTQWSKILKMDAQMIPPMLQNRTQVQLKDKARNMKLDYLKAEMTLPAGFEGVTISKAHKDVFRRIGITVEEDITADDD